MSIPIRANPLGYDSWFVKVTRAFNNSIGEPGKVRLDYVPGNAPILKVFVNLDVSLIAIEDLKVIAGNLVPSGVSVEWYWSDGLPMSYTRLEYLECLGGDDRQYINTELYVTQETRVFTTSECTSTLAGSLSFVYGAEGVVNYPVPIALAHRLGSNGTKSSLRYFWNNIATIKNNVSDSRKISVDYSKNGLYVNGQLKATVPYAEFRSNYPLSVFSSALQSLWAFYGRIYELKIWESEVLKLSFIPAIDPDGKPCMFDTATRNPFYNGAKSKPDFLAGLTLQQVRDMKLDTPGTVNTLSLSIPCEVYNDSEAWGVIEAAQQKGWTFTFYWTDVVAYLTPRIDAVVGNGNYTIAYDYQKSILDIVVDTDVSPAVLRQMQELLTQIVPSSITQTITWSDGMPADYTRAYFLESNGGSRIITGLLFSTGYIKARTSSPVAPDLADKSMYYSTGHYVTGILNAREFSVDYLKRFVCYQENSNIFTVTATGIGGNNDRQYFANTVPKVATVIIDTEEGYAEVNGDRRNMTPFVLEETIAPLPMFARQTWYSMTDIRNESARAHVRIHSFEVTAKANGNVQYGNFIPALDSYGVPGMYDTVSKTFKTNDGTGQFVIGMTLDQVISLKLPPAPASPANELTLSIPGEAMYRQDAQKALNAAAANGWKLTIQYRDIETPEFQGYVVADYIEKPTGAYTYIDTGLSQRLLGYFDYMNTECNQTSDYRYIWGIWPMQSNGRGSIWVQKSDSKIWLYALLEVNCEINTRHDLVHVLCARRLGDSSSSTYVGLGVDGSWPAYTADWPIPDGITETYRMFAYHSTERLYSARFTDIEHKDIASFIPAIDPDGNPCMFDFVRNQPFYNANGTNKFAFTIGLTQEQAESLVLGDKGSGLTIQVPEGTNLDIMQANNPNVTITIQTIPATTN